MPFFHIPISILRFLLLNSQHIIKIYIVAVSCLTMFSEEKSQFLPVNRLFKAKKLLLLYNDALDWANYRDLVLVGYWTLNYKRYCIIGPWGQLSVILSRFLTSSNDVWCVNSWREKNWEHDKPNVCSDCSIYHHAIRISTHHCRYLYARILYLSNALWMPF